MCGIISVFDREGGEICGSGIRRALSLMDERGSGEGAGYAVYGAYPDFKDYYALHVFFDNVHEHRIPFEEMLERWGRIVHDEEIPTFEQTNLRKVHTPWRYFFRPDRRLMPWSTSPEEEIVTRLVMRVNSERKGALIISSGRNMGVFKAAGWPEEVADFYRIEDYSGYMWLGHNRYPTNTPGWWGGAHPFNLLDWCVIHNGEITSYGTNRRYIESFGYHCTMYTDTEVVAYLADLLMRRHGLPEEIALKAMAPPFWDDIERMPEEERKIAHAIRLTYGGAMMNGPFAIVIANSELMMGLTDRVKLRPLVAGEHDSRLFLSSEEAAIRRMDPAVEKVFMPRAGEPVIGRSFP